MDSKKKKHLEAHGWKVGSAQDFLGLSDAESELVELQLRLSQDIRQRLEKARLTQSELAKRLETSTSRVSHMLSGNEVSTDALIRAMMVLGATIRDVGKVVAGESPRRKRTA